MLRGNLAPRGAVIKPSAATPALMVHTGRAVVFEDIEDFHTRIDDENLDVDETCVLVLKNCGPKGYPGMAEVGNMPLPPKVLRKGITDMVRISDARMSGTAYGTVVLHTAPEAAAGGPLALVQERRPWSSSTCRTRRCTCTSSDEELAQRRAPWKAPEPPLDRGYWKLYIDHVLQADEGADLDFLRRQARRVRAAGQPLTATVSGGEGALPYDTGFSPTRLISVSSRSLLGAMPNQRSAMPRSSRLHQR